MRLGPNDKFWIVRDPNLTSESSDVLFESSLRDLELQIRGGLTMEYNPTLFTDRKEAESEAKRRLTALEAYRAIARAQPQQSIEDVARIALFDSRGKALFEAELP